MNELEETEAVDDDSEMSELLIPLVTCHNVSVNNKTTVNLGYIYEIISFFK